MKMTRFYTNMNYRAYQDEINIIIVKIKKNKLIIMFLGLNNQIAQLAGNQHQITFYNPVVVTITK